jgi:hypothetical protein
MFVHANSWLPVVASALYGVMIVALPKVTAKKPVKVSRQGGRGGGREGLMCVLANLWLPVVAFARNGVMIVGALRIVLHLL